MVESRPEGYSLIMLWDDDTDSLFTATPRPTRRARSLAFGVIGFAVTASSGEAAMHNVWNAREGSRPAAASMPAIATAVPSAPELYALVQRAWRHRDVAQAFETFEVEGALTDPVVAAVERQAQRIGIDPLLVVAVIAYENPDLDPGAVSPAGAQGIMQVMPRWKPSFRDECGDDLLAVETNICFGVRILQLHIDDARGSVERGLLAYVGCVRDLACRRYPQLVLRRRLALYAVALAR